MTIKRFTLLWIILMITLSSLAFAPTALRWIGGFSAADDSWVRNGKDIIWYNGSVSSSNETGRIDGEAGAIRLAAPTAIGTATPVAVFDSAGVSNLFEVRDAATPVFAINDGGALDIVGNLASSTGAFTIADTLQVTGLADFDAGLTFGSDTLYPIGYTIANQQIVCGTTATFTGSTTIDATALTTATYVLANQVTAPITTAAYLHVSDPSTTTFTLTSLNQTFAAGTTGITAHYCVIGDQ